MLLAAEAVLVGLQPGVNDNAQRVLFQGKLFVIVGVARRQVFKFKNVDRGVEREVNRSVELVGIRL